MIISLRINYVSVFETNSVTSGVSGRKLFIMPALMTLVRAAMTLARAAMGSRLVTLSRTVYMAGSGTGAVVAGSGARAVFARPGAGVMIAGAVVAATMVIEFAPIVAGVASIVTILAIPVAPNIIPVVPAQPVRDPAPINKSPVSVISV